MRRLVARDTKDPLREIQKRVGLAKMRASLASITSAIEIRVGLPRPNWQRVCEWVDANVPELELNETWTQLARDWLGTLIEALEAGYELSESPQFLLVANSDARTRNRILAQCEHAKRTILNVLSGVSGDAGFGKHVVLVFGDLNQYYDYIADFYPEEGEFALSAGIFLDHGYAHFAVCNDANGRYQRTIAHELTHVLMRHLPLPLWLNEGVTQVVEDIVTDDSSFHVNQELFNRHLAYWNDETIQAFWSGDSFFSTDEGQELSYHLAQVLVRTLMSDHPTQMTSLLNNAQHTDAGNSAVLDFCGTSLHDRVTLFLGVGAWSPLADDNDVG